MAGAISDTDARTCRATTPSSNPACYTRLLSLMLMPLFTAQRGCTGAKKGKEVSRSMRDRKTFVLQRADGRDHSSIDVGRLRGCVDNYANAIQTMEIIGEPRRERRRRDAEARSHYRLIIADLASDPTGLLPRMHGRTSEFSEHRAAVIRNARLYNGPINRQSYVSSIDRSRPLGHSADARRECDRECYFVTLRL